MALSAVQTESVARIEALQLVDGSEVDADAENPPGIAAPIEG